jgi:hypothetical protein
MLAVGGMLFELSERFCLKVYLRAAGRREIQVMLGIDPTSMFSTYKNKNRAGNMFIRMQTHDEAKY